MTVESSSRCRATRKDGTPCGGTARASGYCWNHDPELEERRRAGNARGGANSSNAARARKEIAAIKAMDIRMELAPGLYRAFQQVETGDLPPNVVNAMATVAKAIIDVTNAIQVDEQIEELRQAIERLQPPGQAQVRRIG